MSRWRGDDAGQQAERTLVLTTSYPRSAADFGGHFVRTDAQTRARCSDVHVLAFGNEEPGPEGRVTDPGIEVTWLGGGSLFGTPGVLTRFAERKRRGLLLAWPLLRALWALRAGRPYDSVVAHFLLLSGWPLGVWFAARGRGKPRFEVVAHGSDVRLFERLPAALRRRIVSDLRATAAQIRFVSSELRARMHAAAGSADLEHYILQQEVAAPQLDLPWLPDRQSARRGLGVKEDEVLMVVVGRLTAGKRVHAALGAACLVPGAHVAVVGDGPELAGLRRTFPDVRFLGELARPEALSWIVASDLLLSASRLEGAPTAIREARLLGVPVVATAAGDLHEWASRDPGLLILD